MFFCGCWSSPPTSEMRIHTYKQSVLSSLFNGLREKKQFESNGRLDWNEEAPEQIAIHQKGRLIAEASLCANRSPQQHILWNLRISSKSFHSTSWFLVKV